MSRQAVIFCAGEMDELTSFYPELPIGKGALIVCADGGFRHAKVLGIRPDILIGDFDSIEEKVPEIPRLTYPVRKDVTDSFLAADYCLEQGCRELWILGGVGSRWDHSLSNIVLLKYIQNKGGRGFLRDANNEAFLLESPATLAKREGWYLSLLPFGGDAKGVTVTGVSYPVEKETFYLADSLGISNQIKEEFAEISIEQGQLLAIFSKDKKRKENL